MCSSDLAHVIVIGWFLGVKLFLVGILFLKLDDDGLNPLVFLLINFSVGLLNFLSITTREKIQRLQSGICLKL